MKALLSLIVICSTVFAQRTPASSDVDGLRSSSPSQIIPSPVSLAACSCPQPNCSDAVPMRACLKEADAKCREICPDKPVGRSPYGKSQMQPRKRDPEHILQRDEAVKSKVVRAERPGTPAALSCSENGSCPGNQACVTKRSILTSEVASGQCVGQVCYLAPRQDDQKVRCPSGQVCVAQPRRGGGHVTDVPGLCADRAMNCKVSMGCGHMGKDWVCQNRPNGDGPVCKGEDCGLCIHFGDGGN